MTVQTLRDRMDCLRELLGRLANECSDDKTCSELNALWREVDRQIAEINASELKDGDELVERLNRAVVDAENKAQEALEHLKELCERVKGIADAVKAIGNLIP